MSSTVKEVDPLFDDDPDDVPEGYVLTKIWDAPRICRGVTPSGKPFWTCGHCNTKFPGQHNATKALAHAARKPGHSVAICRGKQTPGWQLQYGSLYAKFDNKRVAIAVRKQDFSEHWSAQDNRVLDRQLERKGLERTFESCVTPIPGAAVMPAPITGPLPKVADRQMTLTGRPYNTDENCLQIGRNKLARALFGNGISFQFINDAAFREAVEYIATIHPKKWRWMDRHQLSGPILNDIYKTQLAENHATLQQESDHYGYCLMGDGATINKVPLINILAQAGQDHPLQLEIVDCSDRMASGLTKDAYYIASKMRRHIIIIGKENGDLIIFDGASNVQKAGRLLSVDFPMLTCIHDPAHCIHLFFGDVFKLLPISLMCKFYRRVYFWCQGPCHAYTAGYNQCCQASPESGTKLVKLSTIRFGIFIGCFIRHCRNKNPTLTFMSMCDSLRENSKTRAVPIDLRRLVGRDEYWKSHHMICKFTGPLSLALRWADRKGPGMHMLHYLCLRAEETMLGMMDEVNKVLFLENDGRWKGSVFEDMQKFKAEGN